MKTFTRRKTKFAIYRTWNNRFGPGKFHLAYWDTANKRWFLACVSPFNHLEGEYPYQGVFMEHLHYITCRRCEQEMDRFDIVI